MSGVRSADFVLDTSVSAAWVIDAQITPYKLSVLNSLHTKIAIVPALWHIEMSNLVCKYARKNNLTMPNIEVHLAELGELAIKTFEWDASKAARQKQGALRSVTQTALAFGLTSYDAQYLQLALRENLPLATCDEQLCASAKLAGVAIYQP
ncbi:MAG: type II toxin-antitoxin system VapC family toxin [Cytophagales bacterium]|nr:type II toxin-antitoxin system VapC family toxin [Cytophagales bacterium]